MARKNLKCIMCARVAFATGLLATIATVAVAQDTVTPSLAPTILPSPVSSTAASVRFAAERAAGRAN